MLHRSTSRVSAAVALTATLFVWRPALSAQGRGGAAAGPTLVPVTASSLAKHPETYIGATVALTATVERQLSPTVFVVDQDKAKSLPEVVLVIAPTLQSPPPANSYVNVVGDAIAFDPVEVAKRLKDYKLDVAPDVLASFRGKPVVLATAVVGTDMVDLAKKKPAPITDDDVKLTAIMKQVTPSLNALRAAATAQQAAEAKTKAAELKGFFTDVQAVFRAHGIADGVTSAGEAIKFADAASAAAAAAKWTDVTAAATSLNGVCGSCHNAHRERQDDGTYRLKGTR